MATGAMTCPVQALDEFLVHVASTRPRVRAKARRKLPIAKPAVPNCRTCGACCVAAAYSHDPVLLHPFANLSAKEADRIETKNPSFVEVDLLDGEECMAIKKNDPRGRCVALVGTVGRRTSCSVYADRPVACSDFEPGSTYCLDMREKILGRR